jgi:hypothetical protein
MHATIDYNKSQAPNFDAVKDIKGWFGPERWAIISPKMAKITNCGQFALYAEFSGVRGFPVRAWYELYHGEGSWKPEQLIDL